MVEGVASGAFTGHLQNISVTCEQNEGGKGDTSTTQSSKVLQKNALKYSTQVNVLANPVVPTGGDGPSQNPQHQIMNFSHKPTLQQFF